MTQTAFINSNNNTMKPSTVEHHRHNNNDDQQQQQQPSCNVNNNNNNSDINNNIVSNTDNNNNNKKQIDDDQPKKTEFSSEGKRVHVTLEETDLWRKFKTLTNEMIVTKNGRRMFPILKLNIQGRLTTSFHQFILRGELPQFPSAFP